MADLRNGGEEKEKVLEDSLCPLLQKCFKRYRIGTGRKGVSYFRKTETNNQTNHFNVIIKMGRQKFIVHSDTDGQPREASVTYTEPRKPGSGSSRNEEKVNN